MTSDNKYLKIITKFLLQFNKNSKISRNTYLVRESNPAQTQTHKTKSTKTRTKSDSTTSQKKRQRLRNSFARG